jgi:hypothetical protein
MCELITVQFGDRPGITRREYLLSAERNVRLAMDSPDMARPALRMAVRRLEQATSLQQGGAG